MSEICIQVEVEGKWLGSRWSNIDHEFVTLVSCTPTFEC